MSDRAALCIGLPTILSYCAAPSFLATIPSVSWIWLNSFMHADVWADVFIDLRRVIFRQLVKPEYRFCSLSKGVLLSCRDADCLSMANVPVYSCWSWLEQSSMITTPVSTGLVAHLSISSAVIGQAFVFRIADIPLQGLRRLGLGFTTNSDRVELASRFALDVIIETTDDDHADQTFWLNFSEDHFATTTLWSHNGTWLGDVGSALDISMLTSGMDLQITVEPYVIHIRIPGQVPFIIEAPYLLCFNVMELKFVAACVYREDCTQPQNAPSYFLKPLVHRMNGLLDSLSSTCLFHQGTRYEISLLPSGKAGS